MQADVPDALDGLEDLHDRARAHRWVEVVGGCLLARAVSAWIRREPGASEAVTALLELGLEEGDDVMVALGLALRANDSFVDPDPSERQSRDADLARAVVLLGRADDRPVERITAHTACEIALLNRSLFELSAEQAHAALAIQPLCPTDAVDFIIGPVVFNLAETEICWAAMLRQLGDSRGVLGRWHAWRRAERATAAFDMAPGWRRELDALGLLLASMTGRDVSAAARTALSELPAPPPGELRSLGVLQLALALSDARTGRASAVVQTEAAIAALDPGAQPHLFDLALHLATELEVRDSQRPAGLRSTRRQLEHHWAKRLSSLAAMQALIGFERQAGQLEQLSRHARLDELTGIGNRRALTEHLAALERQRVRQIALILLDVDSFKEVNDRHGHLAGDAVLTSVARMLGESIRASDLAVRVGGDEFAIVLGELDLDDAVERAVELLRVVDLHSFDEVSAGLRATVSAGVTVGEPSAIRELWSRADTALYRAKAGDGRLVIRSRLAVSPGEVRGILSDHGVAPEPGGIPPGLAYFGGGRPAVAAAVVSGDA